MNNIQIKVIYLLERKFENEIRDVQIISIKEEDTKTLTALRNCLKHWIKSTCVGRGKATIKDIIVCGFKNEKLEKISSKICGYEIKFNNYFWDV